MSREEIYGEMKELIGIVPSFFKSVPDTTLELEWNLFKRIELEEGEIPSKYRELIGVSISAATKCHYCTLFHTEMAKVHGASDREIEEALHCAKNSTGWSTYINGLQIDYNVFRDEVKKVCDYVQSKEVRKAA